MTSEQEQARVIAERIARRVSAGRKETASNQERSGDGNVVAELSAMRAGLDDLRQRLLQLESRLAADEDTASASSASLSTAALSSNSRYPRLSGIYVPASHPSQEKFGVEEATVAELVDFFEGEKKCELEPGGKPCDHCAMCSTRGF
jgi:hypothetical protein